jgi:hypothetical protein
VSNHRDAQLFGNENGDAATNGSSVYESFRVVPAYFVRGHGATSRHHLVSRIHDPCVNTNLTHTFTRLNEPRKWRLWPGFRKLDRHCLTSNITTV